MWRLGKVLILIIVLKSSINDDLIIFKFYFINPSAFSSKLAHISVGVCWGTWHNVRYDKGQPFKIRRSESWLHALLEIWWHFEILFHKVSPWCSQNGQWAEDGRTWVGPVNRGRAPTNLPGSSSASTPQGAPGTKAFECCIQMVLGAILPWRLYPHIKAHCFIRKKSYLDHIRALVSVWCMCF